MRAFFEGSPPCTTTSSSEPDSSAPSSPTKRKQRGRRSWPLKKEIISPETSTPKTWKSSTYINTAPTSDNDYFNAIYQGIPVGGYIQMVAHMLEGIMHTDIIVFKSII